MPLDANVCLFVCLLSAADNGLLKKVAAFTRKRKRDERKVIGCLCFYNRALTSTYTVLACSWRFKEALYIAKTDKFNSFLQKGFVSWSFVTELSIMLPWICKNMFQGSHGKCCDEWPRNSNFQQIWIKSVSVMVLAGKSWSSSKSTLSPATLLFAQRPFVSVLFLPLDLIKAGATQTETSLLKQYVAGERVDLLDELNQCLQCRGPLWIASYRHSHWLLLQQKSSTLIFSKPSYFIVYDASFSRGQNVVYKKRFAGSETWTGESLRGREGGSRYRGELERKRGRKSVQGRAREEEREEVAAVDRCRVVDCFPCLEAFWYSAAVRCSPRRKHMFFIRSELLCC